MNQTQVGTTPKFILGYVKAGTRSYELLAYVADKESATPEADLAIKEMLDNIGQQLNSTRRLLDE